MSEHGYGKRSSLDEYRVTNRGGKGVRAMKLTDKTGNLVAIKDVNDTDDLMIINKSGITIRLRMSDLRTIGRATQGVRLIKIGGNDEISSVAKVAAEEEKEEVETQAILVESSNSEATVAIGSEVVIGLDEDSAGASDTEDEAEEADLA